MEKQYCLERIISFDSKHSVETWKRLNVCHDNIAVFNNFLVEGYRVYDMKNKKEVKRRIENLAIYDISRNEGI